MENKSLLLMSFTDKVYDFISDHKLEDRGANLIYDYIEELHTRGVDLSKRDVEKEIYIFYNYHSMFNDVLPELGEEKFIDIITNEEISKIEDELYKRCV